MPANRLILGICCLALCLLTRPLVAWQRISDDYESCTASFQEEPADALPAPPKESMPQAQALWQEPSMMECAIGECQECCPQGGWVGGVGVYVLKPHWTTNPAFATSATVGGVALDSQTDFQYSYYASPLVWLGYVGECGLGARTRFWLFDQSARTTLTNDGSATFISAAPLNYLNSSSTAGDVLSFTSSLDMDVIDFEATQTFEIGAFIGQLSAGGRYTRIEQSYSHVESPLTALDDSVLSEQAFNGFGPSIGGEVRRAVGFNGLSLYANGRGSVLFGRSWQQATNINNNAVTNFGSYANWDVVPAFETEMGALWQLDTARGRMFLDAGLVGMALLGAGNAANNQLLINSTDDQADKNAALGFFGFKFAAGMSY